MKRIVLVALLWMMSEIPRVAAAATSEVAREEYKKLGFLNPSSLEIVCQSKGIKETGQYSFIIYKAMCDERTIYVFSSSLILDWGASASVSDREIVMFFVNRLKGIINDLEHGRHRSDLGDRVLKSEDPIGSALLPMVYLGYLVELENVTKQLRQTLEPRHGAEPRGPVR